LFKPGIEASSTASLSVPFPLVGLLTGDVTSDVEVWLSGAEENEGWVFVNSDPDGWDFASSESATPPQLSARATFTTIEDTTITQLDPNGSYGDFSDVYTDLLLTVFAPSEYQGLLKIPSVNIPNEATLVSAELWLYSREATTGVVGAYRMTQSWNEGSTWNDFEGNNGVTPGVEAESGASFIIVAPPADVWVIADVTADVAFWLSGGRNQGWAFLSSSSDGWGFWSSEYSQEEFRPFLYITYSAGMFFYSGHLFLLRIRYLFFDNY